MDTTKIKDEENYSKYITRGRDTDFYLLQSLDDEKLLKILSLNKEFLKLGSKFFEKRLKEKYPLLVKFKPMKMNFTKYYLSQVYYIAKLKEDYGIDYVPAPTLNPKIYYYQMEKYSDFGAQYSYIGETGDMNLVKANMNNLDYIESQKLMNGIASSGNVELLKYMENEEFPISNLSYLANAIHSNNPKMVEYVRENLQELYQEEELMEEYIYGYAGIGDLEMVKYFDSYLEPNHYYQQILGFCGTLDVFKFFLNKLEKQVIHEELDNEELEQDIMSAIHVGVTDNHLDILSYLINNESRYIKEIRKQAEYYRNEDVLDLLNQ